MATNFEPQKCTILVQSTKIGTHENKAIHSIWNIVQMQHDFVDKIISNKEMRCQVYANYF